MNRQEHTFHFISTESCMWAFRVCACVCVLWNLGHSCTVMSALRSRQPASGVKCVGLLASRVGENVRPQIAEDGDGKEFVVLSLGFKCHTHLPYPNHQPFFFFFFPSLRSILWSPITMTVGKEWPALNDLSIVCTWSPLFSFGLNKNSW